VASSDSNSSDLIEYIRHSVIGRDDLVMGPFGLRPVVYADYTASGRSLEFIENYIAEAVLPLYANTHTESSGTGLQTSRFREEARDIIRECFGASDEHAVLFCGSGSTHAISKLISALGLSIPSELEDTFHLDQHIPDSERPVVFIGPFEHHSNELPWRESIADVVTIEEDSDGHVSLAHLREELEQHAHRPLKIGSFSAASNVTGIITDCRSVSALLHEHSALAFWDFAAAAPYVDINMGATEGPGTHFDAVFVSPHKFIGGPGTPGLLVARKELFANRVPVVPGGGTVTYVNPDDHDYVDDVERREEGGTPAIVESIRAGLVFQLKDAVGVDEIRRLEESFVSRAIQRWATNPNIEILGSHDAERLSIVSFVVRHRGQYLHHNFVVALLNDLFGIQSRGGCSCAGPYGHRLLGIDIDRSHEFEREVNRGCEGIKPGWVRVNFNYFESESTFAYVLDAVDMVADRGWSMLPQYEFSPDTGLWQHREGLAESPMSLLDIDYSAGQMEFPNRRHQMRHGDPRPYLQEAVEILDQAQSGPDPLPPPNTTADFEHLRWFPYPNEVGIQA
jgi:selenocysteine lyase/cysteine desulfurase